MDRGFSLRTPACYSGTVDVAGKTLAGKVRGTGSWTEFPTEKPGTLGLPADRHTLDVKAKNLVSEGVMNLQSITFRPVK